MALPQFTDQVVWITGASSGIGEALVKAFAQTGARLVLSARRTQELQRVAAATGLPADKVLTLPLDLTATDTLPAKANEAIAHWGRIDVMVHNGGVSQRSLAKDTLPAVDRQLMETNYFGAVALTKALLPHFLQRKSGHFVVISSVMGKFGAPLRSGYCASKHALHGFFDALRAECWRENILVTLVCPGYVQTNVSVNALTGTGGKQNTMDEATAKGIPADVCARRIVLATSEGRHEVNIAGPKETLGLVLKRTWPGLLARMLRTIKTT
jgi:NADP-dependent 3-hydroxy acid dehydrogenase YdfG